MEKVEKEPILVHVATAEGSKFPYEVLFRSVMKHLVDSATSEFLFVVDFFRTSSIDTFNRFFSEKKIREEYSAHIKIFLCMF